MDEVMRVLAILTNLRLTKDNQRESLLGQFLTINNDHLSFDSFDIYFNRSENEQIDIQAGSYTFNLGEWTNALHKLSELLLLKGVQMKDMERLHAQFSTHSKVR
jgi:hypothetical protein